LKKNIDKHNSYKLYSVKLGQKMIFFKNNQARSFLALRMFNVTGGKFKVPYQYPGTTMQFKLWELKLLLAGVPLYISPISRLSI